MEKQIGAAILSAIVCMPSELGRLIGQYLTVLPHRFTAAGFEDVDGRCITDGPSTELAIDETTGCWRTFVSDVPLSYGETEWSVDFSRHVSSVSSGWIGVGVTSVAGNRSSLPDKFYGLMAGATEWLIGIIFGPSTDNGRQYLNDWSRIHAGKTSNINQSAGIVPDTDRRICFSADRRTGVVSAKFSPIAATNSVATLTFDNSSIPFGCLRPCIVVAGSARIRFRSGPPIPIVTGHVFGQAVVVQAVVDKQ